MQPEPEPFANIICINGAAFQPLRSKRAPDGQAKAALRALAFMNAAICGVRSALVEEPADAEMIQDLQKLENIVGRDNAPRRTRACGSCPGCSIRPSP
jgi:hypothetical protein